MTSQFVIISPELKPGQGGVGDHTLRLIEKWSGHDTVRLIVPGQQWTRSATLPFEVEDLGEDSRAIRQQLSRAGKLLVQYSAYGYDRLGYPRRLIRAIVDWKRKSRGLLVILFHEIWTFQSVLNKNALIQHFHRRGIKRLLDSADAAFTTTSSQVKHLGELASARPVRLLPVGSNIGPPREFKRQREKGAAVLFGLQATRIRTLQRMKNSLGRLAAARRILKIVTVGAASSNQDADEAGQLRELGLAGGFEQRGAQPENAISELLTTASFGISGQDALSYEKSSTFMAYAAHELNVLNACGDQTQGEPLCWVVGPAELARGIPENELQIRAARLRDWQQRSSSWDSIAAQLGDALKLNREACASGGLAAP